MAIYRTYECPHCLKCFDFLHHPNDEPPPSFCPLCGADVSGKKKKRVVKVDRIRSPSKPISSGGRPGVASQSVDGLYRHMESSSESRMQEAADMLGVDKASLSGMRLTNMRDNLRAGDMSNMPSNTPSSATQIIGAPEGNMTFQQNTQAVKYARSVTVGPEASTGKQFRNSVVSGHQMRQHQVARAGQLNKK